MLRDNLARIRKEPSLLVIEIVWRWTFGAVAICLIAFAFVRLQHAIVVTPEEESLLASLSPVIAAQVLAGILSRALPFAIRLAAVVVPALLLLWTIAASVGRAVILSRLAGAPRTNWSGVLGTHALRALSFVGLAGGYVTASFAAAFLTNPENPNLLVVALVFLLFFGVVVAIWIWVHWVFSLATIYPVIEGSGTFSAVRSALRLLRTNSKELAGIATANGTARSVVALFFTIIGLLPLPLYRVAPATLMAIEVVIALIYCVVSDWMLLGRLAGYLEVATSAAKVPAGRDGEVD